jgi:molecular chaperone GrpE
METQEHDSSENHADQSDEAKHEEHKKKKKKDEIIEELRKSIEERDAEIKKLTEAMMYLQADFENFKKMKAKEKLETLRYGNEMLIKELLFVMDNLERALDHASQTEDAKSIHDGVQITLNELLRVLEKSGVTRVEAIGKKFDPAIHEALFQEEKDGVEPDTVISELEKGYLLHGRLLRPSRVIIAKHLKSSG